MGALKHTVVIALLPFVLSTSVQAQTSLSDGPCVQAVSETVYVPSFSHVRTHERRTQPLASTLVIHNVDPDVHITVSSAAQYDSVPGFVRALAFA